MTSQPQPSPDYFGERLSPAEREARRAAREEQQRINNRRLGLLIFQFSWFLAFIALTVVNWQLRFSYTSWPPENVQAMGIWLPTLASGCLLVGVILARRARVQILSEDRAPFMRSWLWTMLLGVVFVAIMAFEWVIVGVVDTQDTQYQAVFRLMTGFHMAHALAVGGYMFYIWRGVRQAHTAGGAPFAWAVESASKMWDFVFVAWILFYVVLYLWRS